MPQLNIEGGFLEGEFPFARGKTKRAGAVSIKAFEGSRWHGGDGIPQTVKAPPPIPTRSVCTH